MGVYFGRERWIPVVSHSRIYRCLKEGIFWEGGVDFGSVAYSGEKGGYIMQGGVDSGREAYLYKGWGGGYILEGRGTFWEGGIDCCRKE